MQGKSHVMPSKAKAESWKFDPKVRIYSKQEKPRLNLIETLTCSLWRELQTLTASEDG